MSHVDPHVCRCGHDRGSHWSYGVQQGRCEFCRCPGFHKTPLTTASQDLPVSHAVTCGEHAR